MTKQQKKKHKLNRFFLCFGAVLVCLLLSAVMFTACIRTAAALEQELRCGMAEHIHDDGCYEGDILSCTVTEHSHDGNCYILLLGDNNVNSVLSLTDDSSLETVIDEVVSEAGGDENELSPTSVAALNTVISEDETLPDLVLNENINTLSAVTQDTQDTQQQTQQQTLQTETDGDTSGGAALLSVGDDPVTGSYNANFYIYLDGEWTCIGTLRFTSSRSGRNYIATLGTSGITDLINSSLGTSYSYDDFELAVSSSRNSGYTTNNVTVGSVNTTLASSRQQSTATSTKYVRFIPVNGNASSTAFAFYTVTFVYPDGTVQTRYVRANTDITMPDGNYSWSDGTNTYAAGETVTVTGTTQFTASILGPVTYISINYNINFPDVSGVTVATVPTIAGISTGTVTDGFSENTSAVIRGVSQSSVSGSVDGNTTGLSRVIQFRGWRVGNSDVILQPNTTLVWDELKEYASGSVLNLTAVWDYSPLQTASFFIRFDSVAVDTEGNITGQDQNLYTNELFSAYVGGVDTSLSTDELNDYAIADTTADNSYGADQEIRALYGERSDGVWLSAFPSDDSVFSQLVTYAQTGYLSVDGEPVKVEDLNDRAYAIRWYVFKSQSDAWHIDGKLVKKEGVIRVYKTFAGNNELITAAKSGFYIDAHNNADGISQTLTLDEYVEYDAVTDTYMWEITGVDYGESWTLTEYPSEFADDVGEHYVYSEYAVVDARGDQSKTGVGTSVDVNGMTYALDEGVSDILRCEFTNIYNQNDSIVIKKQDSRTGNSIGGATFSVLQNGQLLKFVYDTAGDRYIYDPENGTETVLEGTVNGYFEIAIENFSYDTGNITVREVAPPEGYAPIGDIEIGYIDDTQTVGIVGGNSDLIKYVGGVLIVSNSTDAVSVTAKKNWDCPESEWVPVTVELMANDRVVTSVIAGVTPSVVLSADNGWSYTWQNLPVYVNGEKITWTVVERVIGTEQHKADGSFVNWLVSYELPVYTTAEDGTQNILLAVTNTTKRVMLRLTKTDLQKTTQLPGATFTLEAVDADGNVIAGEIAKTATTGDAGTLIFDNLKSEVRYRLTEITPPNGYIRVTEYIYFTIDETGTVTVEENYFAEAGSTAYNITVRNAQALELPSSGGIGNSMFYIGGTLLMLLGIYIIYTSYKRRWAN